MVRDILSDRRERKIARLVSGCPPIKVMLPKNMKHFEIHRVNFQQKHGRARATASVVESNACM